jgi:hypothetical protein
MKSELAGFGASIAAGAAWNIVMCSQGGQIDWLKVGGKEIGTLLSKEISTLLGLGSTGGFILGAMVSFTVSEVLAAIEADQRWQRLADIVVPSVIDDIYVEVKPVASTYGIKPEVTVRNMGEAIKSLRIGRVSSTVVPFGKWFQVPPSLDQLHYSFPGGYDLPSDGLVDLLLLKYESSMLDSGRVALVFKIGLSGDDTIEVAVPLCNLAPVPKSPAASTICLTTRPWFTWNDSMAPENLLGFTCYEVDVCPASESFDPTTNRVVGAVSPPLTTWQVGCDLAPGDYFWQVRRVGSGWVSPTSRVQRFSVVSPAAFQVDTFYPITSSTNRAYRDECIVIDFNKKIDVNTLTGTISLVGSSSGTLHPFLTVGDSSAGGSSRLRISTVPVTYYESNETITVTIAPTLKNVNGTILDGDNDGNPGGTFSRSFYVGTTLAGPPAPTNLHATVASGSVGLYIDLPSNASLGSCRVYYASGSNPGIYTGIGANEGTSPREILLNNTGVSQVLVPFTGLAPGEYHFAATSVDLSGRESVFSQDLEVHLMATGILSANAGPDRTIACRQEATLSGQASGGTPPYLYRWDFDGDGIDDWGPYSSGNASHTYTVSQTFNARLTVSDSDSPPVTATDTVIISVEGCDQEGPIILNVRHEPVNPTTNDFVYVYADISDISGVGGAITHWWKQGTVVPTEMGWIQMSRIGTSNTWYSGKPIPVWPAGTVINYEISAYDGNRYVSNSAVYSYTVGAVVDSQGPVLYGMYPAPGSIIYSARPTIECRMVDNGGSGDVDESRIIIKVDGVNVSASAHRNDDEVTYKPATNLTDGLHTVWVSIPDMSHNVSTYQWQFTVDTTPQTGNLIEHFDIIVPTYGHIVDSFDIWQDYVAWLDETEHRVRLFNLKTQQEIWQSPTSQVPSDNDSIHMNGGKIIYIDTEPTPDKFYVYDISSRTLMNTVWTYDNTPMNPDISGKYITFESLDAAHQDDYVWVKDIATGQIYQGPQNGMYPRIEGTKVLYQTSPMSGEDVRLWDFISGSDTVICNQSGDQEGPAIANGLCVFENQNTSPDHFALTTLSGSGYQQLSVGRSVGYPDIDDRYAVWVELGTTPTGTYDNVWIKDYISGQKYQLTAGIADVDGSPKVSGNRVAYRDKTGMNRLLVAELATEAVWPQAKVFATTDMTHFDGLAVDEAGNVYISGRRNSDDKVVKYDRNGNLQFDFGTESKIDNPRNLDAKNGTVYVCSAGLKSLIKYSDLGVYSGTGPVLSMTPIDAAIRGDGHVFALTGGYVRHYDANMVFVEDVTKSMLGLGTLNSCATTEDNKLVVADTSDRISVWDLNSEHLIGSVSNAGRYVAIWKDRFVYVTDQGCCISILNIGSGTPTLLVDGHHNIGWDSGVLRDITGLNYKYFEDPKYIDIGPLGEVYFYNNYTGYEGVVKLPPFFYSDTSAPTVTVLSPANGTRTASGVLRFQITDNMVGVDEEYTRVYLDDQDISGMFVQQEGIYNAELVAGSHSLMNGNHVLKIRAADYAGNTQVTNIAFTIDAKPPSPITFLTALDTGTGGSIQLDWTSYVEANETDLAGYYVFASPSPISVTNGLQPVNSVLIPLGTKTYQVTGLNNNIDYYFAVAAVDSLGNIAEIVVNTGPVTPHAQPLPDLYVSPSDVVFEPSPLTQGNRSGIVITIHNCGLAAANSFGLAVYLGDPNQGGIRIDDGTILLNATVGGIATASIPYIPVNIGWEQLFVILDPSNAIQEQNKANNSIVIGGYVSAPIAPAGDFNGNNWEDLADFAIFARAWMSQPGQANWNPACDISSPKDDIIDWSDFAVFVEYWLAGIEYIPPAIYAGDFDGNGQEDLMDFAILASAWMSQPGEINWNQSCDISDPKDNIIDWTDLAVFVTDWLVGAQ